MDIESRVGKIQANQEKVYALISDFSNLGNYVPHDKVNDFTSDTDSCSFTVDTIGKFGMKIIEREPTKTVKIANDDSVPFKFNLWIQLKEVAENDTRVKVTLKADLNPMLKMVAKKPLTQFVDTLLDKLEMIK
ncbi:MAG: SRPBCC family protein [Salinivirgaceae bacterium]|nr:SRPBCC family protein [Salinivirgaceae bacterium]